MRAIAEKKGKEQCTPAHGKEQRKTDPRMETYLTKNVFGFRFFQSRSTITLLYVVVQITNIPATVFCQEEGATTRTRLTNTASIMDLFFSNQPAGGDKCGKIWFVTEYHIQNWGRTGFLMKDSGRRKHRGSCFVQDCISTHSMIQETGCTTCASCTFHVVSRAI